MRILLTLPLLLAPTLVAAGEKETINVGAPLYRFEARETAKTRTWADIHTTPQPVWTNAAPRQEASAQPTN